MSVEIVITQDLYVHNTSNLCINSDFGPTPINWFMHARLANINNENCLGGIYRTNILRDRGLILRDRFSLSNDLKKHWLLVTFITSFTVIRKMVWPSKRKDTYCDSFPASSGCQVLTFIYFLRQELECKKVKFGPVNTVRHESCSAVRNALLMFGDLQRWLELAPCAPRFWWVAVRSEEDRELSRFW